MVNLEKTKFALELYAEKNKKYKEFIEEINSVIQQKIDELKY